MIADKQNKGRPSARTDRALAPPQRAFARRMRREPTNNDVLSNIDGVPMGIHRALTTTPTPDPSPQGGGEKKERPRSP
jgi:hypothetical protein